MAIFKCKMCGGTLEINNNETVAVCEYCGTKQTLPKLDDEKRVQLYDRANYFRRENEFDKAMGIYEMILSDDKEDCESYWGIVLCRYGIEYVEDPRTHKRIPTVNRAQFTSIFDDDDYKNAIKYADGYQKDVYEAEASVIDKIQKGILEISNKEEPFDVFICYKETDSHGNRTQDSVYAQDIYAAITKEGYKVFFSRITLEDKLGSAYEPYIFAALNSAKVMLVVGTEKDNFNAVWVKNEWSRFLSLIKAGKDKALIPVYKDISPYEMPEEFQYLQSQDMGKIGFMQDLVRGISKLVETNKTTVKETVVVNNSNNTAPLLERAFMFLEDGDWTSADEYFEKVLDIDPKCAEAYLGKLMVDLKVRRQDDLEKLQKRIDENSNFPKALKFASLELKSKLESYKKTIELNIKETIYSNSVEVYKKSRNIDALIKAANSFKSISDYKDSAELAQRCLEKTEETRKNNIYSCACDLMNNKQEGKPVGIEAYERAIKKFNLVLDWKDSQEKSLICKQKIEELKEQKEKIRIEKEQQKNKKKTITAVVLSAISTFIDVGSNDCDENKWKEIVAISADRYHSVGLKSDGTVVAVGGNEYGQCDVSGWKDIVAISAGGEHTVGLKSDGTVVATKYTGKHKYYYGPCDVNGWKDIVAISASDYHTVGLKADGTVVAVGNKYYKRDVSDWTDIVAISAGNRHIVGLKSDGTVVVVGKNDDGQCDVGDWTDIVAISAKSRHIVGLKSDGTVVAVGDNEYGQCDVDDWMDIVAISAGYSHTIGLKSDGTVVAVGLNEDGQCDISDWTDIISVAACGFHTVGLKLDGTVVAVGDNSAGQCLVGGKK